MINKVVKSKLPNFTTHPHLSTVYAAYLIDDDYKVYLSKTGKYTHLRIRRLDDKPIIEYSIFQDIKNKLLGNECTAVQVFPNSSDYIDNTNTYHLFTWDGIDVPNLKKMYAYKAKAA